MLCKDFRIVSKKMVSTTTVAERAAMLIHGSSCKKCQSWGMRHTDEFIKCQDTSDMEIIMSIKQDKEAHEMILNYMKEKGIVFEPRIKVVEFFSISDDDLDRLREIVKSAMKEFLKENQE